MALRRLSVGGLRPKGSAEDTILVSVDSVELLGKMALTPKVSVHIDMPGKEDQLEKTGPKAVVKGHAKFGHLVRYDVSAASRSEGGVRDALVAALQTEEEEDSEVLFIVNAVGSKETELGTATFRLERILATRNDVKAHPLPLHGAGNAVIGSVNVSITALAALRAFEAEANEAMAKAEKSQARRGGAVIHLSVSKLSLRQLPTSKTPPSGALRAELVGVASAAPISCPAIKLQGGESDVDFDATFAVPAGSQLRTDLGRARRTGVLKMRIAVDGVNKSGKASALGVAEVNLSGSSESLEEMEGDETTLVVHSVGKDAAVIGSLNCSVEAADLLAKMDAEVRAPPPPCSGTSLPPACLTLRPTHPSAWRRHPSAAVACPPTPKQSAARAKPECRLASSRAGQRQGTGLRRIYSARGAPARKPIELHPEACEPARQEGGGGGRRRCHWPAAA